MALAMSYQKKHAGLVLFDQVVNEEDFLDFLTEWSDSIAQPIEPVVINNTCMSNNQSSKRKIEEVSKECTIVPFFQPSPIVFNTVATDLELAKLPLRIFEAFNGGDLQFIRQKITQSMTINCKFQTMKIDNPLIGRHNYYDFLHAMTVSHPDMVFVTKNYRVLNNTAEGGEGKCIKFKYFFTGTNVCPNAAQSYYYDKSDYLTKYLDTSKATESEKAAMTALISHHRIHGTPYLCFGRGSGVFKLNEDNLVNSIYFDWKLTSICSPIIERNGL